ncbi:MAG: DUF6465 family protein [Lachnospira sp.]
METKDIFGTVSEDSAKSVKSKKETTKKAATKTKVTKKTTKAADTTKTVKTEVYIQYADCQANEDTIVKMVMDQVKDIKVKSLKLYIKPEDNACYYVVNDTVEGKVDLF